MAKITKETSYEKGNRLEHEFAEYMKTHLGWKETRVGVHLVGNLNRKGASVDIVAKRMDKRGKEYAGNGLLFSALCIALGLISYAIDNEYLLGSSIALLIVALMFIVTSVFLNQEHCLVECKNLSTKAVASHIDKTLREINDYKSTGDTEFKFRHHYFVSTNGYVETTLKYAMEKGIVCYVKNGDTFEVEKYWKQ